MAYDRCKEAEFRRRASAIRPSGAFSVHRHAKGRKTTAKYRLRATPEGVAVALMAIAAELMRL